MIKKYARKTGALVAIVLFISVLSPAFNILAATQTGANKGVSLSATIDNPLGVKTIPELITVLLQLVARIGAIVCVFFIIYSGFLFIKAQGQPAELTKAKNIFLWSVIGTAVLLGASVIAGLIQGTVESVVGPIK